MDTLKEFDTTIVAITPQLAEASRLLISRQKITFDLLSDPGNGYTATLGLRFKLPDDLKAVYLTFGNDLAVRNGEDSWTLPMPGRFVVDRAGVVRAVDVDPQEPRLRYGMLRTARLMPGADADEHLLARDPTRSLAGVFAGRYSPGVLEQVAQPCASPARAPREVVLRS